MGQENEFLLSFFEVNNIVSTIKDMREMEDISMHLNIKLGLIEDDLADRAQFYNGVLQQINSNHILKDDDGNPVVVDQEGNNLSQEEAEKIPEQKRAYKIKDMEEYQQEIISLRTYPLDISFVTENISLADFENIDLNPARRKKYADALIPLIKRKSGILNSEGDDETEVKSFKQVREELIEKYVPKEETEDEESEVKEEKTSKKKKSKKDSK